MTTPTPDYKCTAETFNDASRVQYTEVDQVLPINGRPDVQTVN